MMKAFLYREAGAAWKLEDVADVEPGPREVVVRTEAAGVCGTDVHYRFGRIKPKVTPLIPGHEIAGSVVAVGGEVIDVAVGDRVCVHYIVSCGQCKHCDAGHDNRCRRRRSIGTHLDGGFAEYVVVPGRNAFKLPENVSSEEGAVIGCAVATAYHALQIAGFAAGDSVAVYGLGGVGMQVVKWARCLGASLVVATDIADEKLSMAREFGADVVLHSVRETPHQRIHSLTDGYGIELAFECSGHPDCMRDALRSIHGKSGYESGKLVGVAAYLDSLVLDEPGLFREGAFLRSGDHTRQELREIIELVSAGRYNVNDTITHRFAFTEIERPLALLERKEGQVIRAVLEGSIK